MGNNSYKFEIGSIGNYIYVESKELTVVTKTEKTIIEKDDNGKPIITFVSKQQEVEKLPKEAKNA